MRAWRLIAVGLILFFGTTVAYASSPYDALAQSIQTVDLTGDLSLEKGYWKTSFAGTNAIWHVRHDNRANIRINYQNGILTDSHILFYEPIDVRIVGADFCTDYRIKSLYYNNTGEFDGRSDFKIVGAGSCKSELGRLPLEENLRLSAEPSALLQGRVFSGLYPSEAKPFHARSDGKCTDSSCSVTVSSKGPVTLVVLRPTEKDNPAAKVTLRQGKQLYFSGDSYVVIHSGSLKVRQLQYDVINDRGSGTVEDAQIVPSRAHIAAGRTRLEVPESVDTLLDLSEIEISKDGKV